MIITRFTSKKFKKIYYNKNDCNITFMTELPMYYVVCNLVTENTNPRSKMTGFDNAFDGVKDIVKYKILPWRYPCSKLFSCFKSINAK